jgi:hypothetical protein
MTLIKAASKTQTNIFLMFSLFCVFDFQHDHIHFTVRIWIVIQRSLRGTFNLDRSKLKGPQLGHEGRLFVEHPYSLSVIFHMFDCT